MDAESRGGGYILESSPIRRLVGRDRANDENVVFQDHPFARYSGEIAETALG